MWCAGEEKKLPMGSSNRVQCPIVECAHSTNAHFEFPILSCSIISVKAKSFADREIRYTLKAQGQGAGTFNIGPTSGIVKLAKELDFEDLRQPHVYSLVVTATEDSGGFSTSVEVSCNRAGNNGHVLKTTCGHHIMLLIVFCLPIANDSRYGRKRQCAQVRAARLPGTQRR